MQIYHGSKAIVEFPEIRKSRFTKDFSWGFYCTNSREQAVKWAVRTPTPVVNKYDYEAKTGLKVLKFEKTTDEWLDFIVHCRGGGLHEYDIVEGAMADDTIWDFIEDFINETISRTAFWELIKFKHPTHQISFHTIRALDCIIYKGSEHYDRA